MKHISHFKFYLCLLATLFLIAGCEKNTSSDNTRTSDPKIVVTPEGYDVSDAPDVTETPDGYAIPEDQTALSDNYSSEPNKSIATEQNNALISESDSEDSIVDLTLLSSTAVYGQVFDMMYYPEKYIGKTIRMKGLYSDYCDESTGKHYFACIIMDATACCSQGIEFILTDDYKYPEDYPSEGDEITVEGIFDVYTEENGSYCTLKDAALY